MAPNSFSARDRLTVDETTYEVFRLERVEGALRLPYSLTALQPYSLKVLLENLLRNEDDRLVTAEQIEALGGWDPNADSGTEIQYTPARVLLQDFTGVQCPASLRGRRSLPSWPPRPWWRPGALDTDASARSAAGDVLAPELPVRMPGEEGGLVTAGKSEKLSRLP